MSQRNESSSTASLADLRQRLEVWSLGARDAMWDWDMDTDRVVYSQGFWSLIGDTEERLELRSTWFKRVHPADLACLEEDMEHCLTGRVARFENQHRLLDKHNNYLWVLATGVALRDENGLVTRFGGSLTDISDVQEREGASVRELFYDLLTELPNRSLFMARLDQSMQRRERVADYIYAVLVIGIDQLEQIHQEVGEIAADQLMVEIADRLRAGTRKNDTVGRIRGDEFTILLDNIRSSTDALRFAQRLSVRIGGPLMIRGDELLPTASIGIAVSEDPYESAMDLLRAANTAMLTVRAAGGGELMANPQRHEEAQLTLEEEQVLSETLDAGALGVTFLPITTLGDDVAAYGVVRTQVPQQPSLTTPRCWELAQSSGLLGAMSRQVIAETLALRDRLREAGQATPLVLALPGAALSLLDESLSDGQLEGLTISISLDDLRQLGDRLGDVRTTLTRSAAEVAVHDFGRAPFSVIELLQLQPQLLFLDRRLISADDDTPVSVLLALAAALNSKVVACGDADTDRTPLQRAGIDYFFALPATAN